MTSGDSAVVERVPFTSSGEYEKKREFTLEPGSRKYDRQFFSLYQYRLKHLRERVHTNAIAKWGDGTKKIDGQTIVMQDKILDITSGKLCWVIGTVFCDLKHKLNILQDVEKGTDDVLPSNPNSYIEGNEHGTVMIEDESGRAILSNDKFLKHNIFVTGCIIAVLGIEIQAGIFEIVDVAFPTVSPQKPLTPSLGKIALISGLNICQNSDDDLKLEILKQYLVGELGAESDRGANSQISRLIIAGDSIKPDDDSSYDTMDFRTTNNYGSKNISKFNVKAFEKLDRFLQELLMSLPVSIMPGENDPVEICLPQQPMHKAIFHSSRQYLNGEYFERTTNPQWFTIDGKIRVLGTSGQNVDDVFKYLTTEQLGMKPHNELTLQIMEDNIKWQNIVPTAPDTLYCYPYDDYDPFILQDETPHVYFVGNQQQFSTKTLEICCQKVKLISVPKFSATGEIVVLDLATLNAETIKIEV